MFSSCTGQVFILEENILFKILVNFVGLTESQLKEKKTLHATVQFMALDSKIGSFTNKGNSMFFDEK